MSDNTVPPTPPRRRRWLRWALVVGGVSLAVLVLGYFVITSSAFLKAVALPRVGQALNARVSAETIQLRPFSGLTLRGVRVETTGTDPLFAAREIRVGYRLGALLRGHVDLNEVAVIAPVIQITQAPDGTSNLDPLFARTTPAPSPPAQPAPPLQMTLRNLSLENGQVRYLRRAADGAWDQVDLNGLTLAVDQLANSSRGRFTLSSQLQMVRSQSNRVSRLESREGATLDFELGPDLLPRSAQGSASNVVERAEGAFAELAGHRALVDCTLVPGELKQLATRFFKGAQPLGQIAISGPFDASKQEGTLTCRIDGIDRQVLNLAGAPWGADCGSTRLNALVQLGLAKGGSVLALSGRVNGEQVSVALQGRTTPPLGVQLGFNVALDPSAQSARIQTFTLEARQGQRVVVQSELSRPVNLSWAKGFAVSTDSTFTLSVNDLSLAEWRGWAGELITGGVFNLRLNLVVPPEGRRVSTDLSGGLREFSGAVGSNRVDRLNLGFQMAGQLQDFNQLRLTTAQLEVLEANRAVARLSAKGDYALDGRSADLEVQAESVLPALLQKCPVPGAAITSGALTASGRFTHQGGRTNVSGNLTWTNLSGTYAAYRFQDYHGQVRLEAAFQGTQFELKNLAAAVQRGAEPGGTFHGAGTVDMSRSAGAVSFGLTNLNQQALAPFLNPLLAPQELQSVALNGHGTATFDPQGDSRVKTAIQVTNLLVGTARQRLTPAPLAAEAQFDAGWRAKRYTVHQAVLRLAPTARAKNELQLAGVLDLAASNAAPSDLRLTADSLDVTPWYDLFVGADKTTATAPTPTPSPSSTPAEPKPVRLPLAQGTFDVRIGRFFLREIAASNLVATARVQGSRILVDPVQASLNAAPVNARADIDLGVEGWRYELGAKAEAVPLEPLANTFSPATRGQYQGFLLGDLALRGAGITGPSLQRNLAGRLGFTFTNANLQLTGPKTRQLLLPVAALLRVNELMQSPLDWLHLRTEIGRGEIQLQKLALQSAAFAAESQGAIPLAAEPAQSRLQLPVSFSLRRSLATKANLVPPNAPTNTAYVPLPDFMVVKGTLGEPKSDLNELAITGLLLKSGVGIAERLGVKTDDKTGRLLRGLGDILTGDRPKPADGSKPPTNQPAPPRQP